MKKIRCTAVLVEANVASGLEFDDHLCSASSQSIPEVRWSEPAQPELRRHILRYRGFSGPGSSCESS